LEPQVNTDKHGYGLGEVERRQDRTEFLVALGQGRGKTRRGGRRTACVSLSQRLRAGLISDAPTALSERHVLQGFVRRSVGRKSNASHPSKIEGMGRPACGPRSCHALSSFDP
jgi:hypothetical protein